jgi:hypothetical protein
MIWPTGNTPLGKSFATGTVGGAVWPFGKTSLDSARGS